MSNAYLQNGYKAGLELENAFGTFIASKVVAPARLYHFSDAHLLYIEPSAQARDAEEVYKQIQGWINEFAEKHDIDAIVRLGMADYPFLPRAYTAINDQSYSTFCCWRRTRRVTSVSCIMTVSGFT